MCVCVCVCVCVCACVCISSCDFWAFVKTSVCLLSHVNCVARVFLCMRAWLANFASYFLALVNCLIFTISLACALLIELQNCAMRKIHVS